MSSDPDVFNTNVAAPQEGVKVEDLLTSITDESGRPKYDSVEKAIQALSHSQNHIRTLEAESQIKDDLIKSLQVKTEESNSLQQVIEQLTKEKTSATQETPKISGLTEQQINELVVKALNDSKTADKAVENVKSVDSKLRNKYGDQASKVVEAKAAEYGTTPEKLKQLSAENPELVLALFGDKAPPAPVPSTSSVNISGLPQPDSELKRPQVSLLSGRGATEKNQKQYMDEVRANVYKRLGVTT